MNFPPPTGKVGPNYITPLQVGLGAVLVLVNACISVYLDLGLEVALGIATVRCVTGCRGPQHVTFIAAR